MPDALRLEHRAYQPLPLPPALGAVVGLAVEGEELTYHTLAITQFRSEGWCWLRRGREHLLLLHARCVLGVHDITARHPHLLRRWWRGWLRLGFTAHYSLVPPSCEPNDVEAGLDALATMLRCSRPLPCVWLALSCVNVVDGPGGGGCTLFGLDDPPKHITCRLQVVNRRIALMHPMRRPLVAASPGRHQFCSCSSCSRSLSVVPRPVVGLAETLTSRTSNFLRATSWPWGLKAPSSPVPRTHA